MKRRYNKRRALALGILGRECVDCASKKDLEIDHSDASTKGLDLSRRLHTAPWNAVLLELKKCELRCRPCYIEKSKASGDYINKRLKTCPHCGEDIAF